MHTVTNFVSCSTFNPVKEAELRKMILFEDTLYMHGTLQFMKYFYIGFEQFSLIPYLSSATQSNILY